MLQPNEPLNLLLWEFPLLQRPDEFAVYEQEVTKVLKVISVSVHNKTRESNKTHRHQHQQIHGLL